MSPRPDKPLEDREYPDPDDLNAPASFFSCPFCNELVYEDAPQCPHCHQWVAESIPDWRASRKWYLRGGLWVARAFVHTWIAWLLLTAGAVLFWLLRGGLH